MSQTTFSILGLNRAIMAATPNFVQTYTEIEEINERIRAMKVEQEKDLSGDMEDKKRQKKMLLGTAMDFIRRISAYAMNTNNQSLRTLVSYNESDLKRYSDSKLVGSCQVICNAANGKVAEMADYGIVTAKVNSFQTMINSFDATIPKGRVDAINGGEATKQLATLFKSLMESWSKMDILVDMHKDGQPTFWDEYQKARKIIVTGKGYLAMKVQAVNAQTGEPEPNVTLTIAPAGGEQRDATAKGKSGLVKKTAKGGGAHIKNLPDDIYTITAKKMGLQTVAETVTVVGGETTLVQIRIGKA